MPHMMEIRVYYEDTDAGGVVYYANYLKYAERARTELLRSVGLEQTVLAEKYDTLFVVRKAELDLMKPARLDDPLEISTFVKKINAASLLMQQEVAKGGVLLARISTKIACISSDFQPKPLDSSIREELLKLK